jgi:HK97 family phage portal protein
VSRRKRLVQRQKAEAALQAVSTARGLSWWWPIIREATTGAWQRNEEITVDNVLSNPTLNACVTLISTDTGSMCPLIVEYEANDVPSAIDNPAYSAFLREPNHYQVPSQFYSWWMVSKLTQGNTYALKARDDRRVVRRLYILDPCRTRVLVAPDGSVFYQLDPTTPDLSGLSERVIVPASEIVHDVMCPFFHPLIGVSPIFAAGWPSLLAKHINNNAQNLFANGSSPGGIITAPGHISIETAQRLKADFDTNYSGDNFGKVAVLGDQMAYTPMGMNTAVDSQLIDILRWSDEQIAKVFHMPLFKVGGPLPPYSSVEAVTQLYYTDCLNGLSVQLEQVMTKGLELPIGRKFQFNRNDLLRMDSATTMEIAKEGVGGGIFTPNEARRRFDLPPITGGNTIYLQQQDYSIDALFRRDRAAAAAGNAVPSAPATSVDNQPMDAAKSMRAKMTRVVSGIETAFAA